MTALLPNCGCCMAIGQVVKILLPGSSPGAVCSPGNNNKEKTHLYVENGSEPSLTSRNGQSKPSSVDASKHTLHSRDDIRAAATPTKVHVTSIKSSSSPSNPENHVTSNYVTSRILSIEGSTDEVDSHRIIQVSSGESPKTPSYLKLSCAVSGYNKHSNYANSPPANNSPVSPSLGSNGPITGQRSSRGGEGSDLTPVNSIVQNGHCEGHEVSRSNGHKFDLDLENQVNLDTSKSHTHSCRLTNGAIPKAAVDRNSGCESNHRHSGTADQSEHSNTTQKDCAPLVSGCTDLNGEAKKIVDGHVTPQQKRSPKTQDVSTPNKDGSYFLQIVDSEEQRLKELCAKAEKNLQNDIPEEASGRIRAAIGKANLLTSKKFKQFRGLCNQNMSQSESEPFHTTSQDLAGFWDMVLIQVEDMQVLFSDLDRLQQNGWNSPVREKQSIAPAAARTPRGKASSAPKDVSASTPKSSKSKDAAKAREEARKRLLAAKRAGRQRKASQSDDVEIYVS